jgi:hypothetical protein
MNERMSDQNELEKTGGSTNLETSLAVHTWSNLGSYDVHRVLDRPTSLSHLALGHALFPVRLNDTVMDTDYSWAADIRRNRHIGDFTACKDHDSYQKTFDRLLRDLKAETA